MVDQLPHTLQLDAEQKDLIIMVDSLSISPNQRITISAKPRRSSYPHDHSCEIHPPIPAPVPVPDAIELPSGNAAVRAPESVSSTMLPSIPAINIHSAYSVTINHYPQSQPIVAATPLSTMPPPTSPPPPPHSLNDATSHISLPSPSLSSASSPSSTVKCSGRVKNRRCKKDVKCMPLSYIHPDDICPEEGDIPHYCSSHQVKEPEVFYARGEAVKFSDWIPNYLEKSTQVALRLKMAEPPSANDEPGYVYAYEIRDPASQDRQKLSLKVGCTVDLPRRMREWQKQCKSVEQRLRGHWPGGLEDGPPDDAEAFHASTSEGSVNSGPKGPLCHRVERLVHLELADLVVNEQYLDPDFMLCRGTSTVPSSPRIAPRSHAGKRNFPRHQCSGCGTVHREIFIFHRVNDGRYKGKEWDFIIKPIIEKWGAFVKAYIQDE